MCGIGGLSMSRNSKINVRKLSHELLGYLEFRGGHASGFAYTDRKGRQGVYKDAKPGSQLPLYELPRNSRSAILHTRFATQGDPSDNKNNHPVVSATGNIALVHNGVISNDYVLTKDHKVIGDVDSAIIPALIEDDGLVKAVDQLEGYAAIAWLTRDTGETLHVARLSSSPVHYTWTMDGSFVFASTYEILTAALAGAKIEHGYVFSMGDGDGLAVRDGVIVDVYSGLLMQEDYWSYSRFSGATSGGHTTTVTPPKGSETEHAACTTSRVGSSFGNIEDSSSEDTPTRGYWWDDEDADPADYQALAFTEGYEPETNGPPTLGQDDFGGYYLTREDGNIEFFASLDDLETDLAWLCNLHAYEGAPFPEAHRALKWTNFVIDIGEVRANQPQSWMDDLSLIDYHESPATYNLQYIREGLSNLIMAQA